jgi:hypothetical protein
MPSDQRQVLAAKLAMVNLTFLISSYKSAVVRAARPIVCTRGVNMSEDDLTNTLNEQELTPQQLDEAKAYGTQLEGAEGGVGALWKVLHPVFGPCALKVGCVGSVSRM